jgi:hypothetical protein
VAVDREAVIHVVKAIQGTGSFEKEAEPIVTEITIVSDAL